MKRVLIVFIRSCILIVFIRSCILEYKTYLYIYTIGGNGGLKKKLLQKYTNFVVSFLYNM